MGERGCEVRRSAGKGGGGGSYRRQVVRGEHRGVRGEARGQGVGLKVMEAANGEKDGKG